MDELNSFDSNEPVAMLQGNLPHWRQHGTTYFVTFRLDDAIPPQKLWQWYREREQWLRAHPKPHGRDERAEYYALFVARFERWLDAGYGSCVLAVPEHRQRVENSLRWFDGNRYRLGEFVVMPNHVHAVVAPRGFHALSDTIASWKKFTARRINTALGREGALWHKESFDHIVRDDQELKRIDTYIRRNPARAEAIGADDLYSFISSKNFT